MADEKSQEKGRKGVFGAKRWLEATTWLDLGFNAYEDDARCKVPTYAGPKKFDLRGRFLGREGNRREVSVEVKTYSSAGGQQSEFEEFLVIAYSTTCKQSKDLQAPHEEEFMWVTYHPFAVTKWSKLAAAKTLIKALQKPEYSAYLGGEPVDEELARGVAGRIWVLVMNEQQVEISLTKPELFDVLRVLNRDGDPGWKI